LRPATDPARSTRSRMSGSTPILPDPDLVRPATTLPRDSVAPPRADDAQHYLAFLRQIDGEPETRTFPIFSFGFMLAMLLAVIGLGASLAVERAGDVIPRGSAGAPAVSGRASSRSDNAVPFCRGVTSRQREQLDRALAQMRKTSEGKRLAKRLADHDVCIGVEDLSFNSGYASAKRTWTGSWNESYIVVDKAVLSVAEPAVIAALLVHEATHIDRSISGQACGVFDGCEVLANGVVLEEEIAAHAAEARWWIESGGRGVPRGYGYSLDQLAAAYRQGDAAFRDFVRDLRSDPRDGIGI
jgi:hypothetical protein